MNLNFSGMILAAGYGKRMMPLTRKLPKPLLHINNLTLLDNSINFLQKLGCNQIIVNSHYKHQQIKNNLEKRKDKNNIFLIYEQEILDTGGAVKNAINFLTNDNVIVINSDIFWQNENITDAKLLIKKYLINQFTQMLLVNKKKSFGIKKNNGDFILNDKKIKRFKKSDDIFYYSGFQILKSNVFSNINKKKFSFNEVWDDLIDKELLFGDIMNSNWYHVGDIQGLTIARSLPT